MTSHSSFHPLSISQTQNGGLQIIEHGERKYAPRISEQEWERIKPVLTALNNSGTTRAEMRRTIIEQYNLSPSINQLNAKMAQWGVKPIPHLRSMSARALPVVKKQPLSNNCRLDSPGIFLETIISKEPTKSEPTLLPEHLTTDRGYLGIEILAGENDLDVCSRDLAALYKPEKGSAPFQNSDADKEGIDELVAHLDTNCINESPRKTPVHQDSGQEKDPNSSDQQDLDNLFAQDVIEHMSDIDYTDQDLHLGLSSYMLDRLVASAVEESTLDHAKAFEVMEDIALFLSLLHCSSAAFYIYSKCISLTRGDRASINMRLRAIIGCSRTATSPKELIAARDMLQAVTKQLADINVCRCIGNSLIAVLDANDWHRDFLELENRCKDVKASSIDAVRPCTSVTCAGRMSNDIFSYRSYYSNSENVSRLILWASHQLGDSATSEVLRLSDAGLLGVHDESLLTCSLTQKWMQPQETSIHKVEVAIAVQVFAVVVRCAVRTIGREHDYLIARDVIPEMLKRCGQAMCGCARPEWNLIHIDQLFPRFNARQCDLSYVSPLAAWNIRTYVYDTVSLVTKIAVLQRTRSGTNPNNTTAVDQSIHTFRATSSGINTKAVSIGGFSGSSISSVSICSGESDSMRFFRNTSKRAQRLSSRLGINKTQNFTLPSDMLHPSSRLSGPTDYSELY